MIQEILNKIRIMLVDDDTSILQTTATILEDEGYDVLTCSGGKEAVDKFNYTIFGVILDINMPDMSGLDVFEIIKSKNQYVPIIFHTGYDESACGCRSFFLFHHTLYEKKWGRTDFWI